MLAIWIHLIGRVCRTVSPNRHDRPMDQYSGFPLDRETIARRQYGRVGRVSGGVVTMSRRTLLLLMVLPIVTAVGVLFLGVGYVADLPDAYSSRVSIAFDPKLLKTGGIAGSESVVLAASNYVSFLDSGETVAAVAENAEVDPEVLRDATLSTIVPGTATMSVDVELEDPEAAATAANSYSRLLLKEADSSDVVVARIAGKAAPSEQPSGPPRTILIATTGFLAFILGALVLIVLVVLIRTRRSGGYRGTLGRLVTGGDDASASASASAGPSSGSGGTVADSGRVPVGGQVASDAST